MIKYIEAINTGKGFITHEDQEKKGLAFNVLDNLVMITGNEKEINVWVERVKGKEMTETEYLIKKNEKIKLGLEKELIKLNTEITNNQNKTMVVNNYLLAHI